MKKNEMKELNKYIKNIGIAIMGTVLFVFVSLNFLGISLDNTLIMSVTIYMGLIIWLEINNIK